MKNSVQNYENCTTEENLPYATMLLSLLYFTFFYFTPDIINVKQCLTPAVFYFFFFFFFFMELYFQEKFIWKTLILKTRTIKSVPAVGCAFAFKVPLQKAVVLL